MTFALLGADAAAHRRRRCRRQAPLQRGDQVTLLVEPDPAQAETLAFAIGGQVGVLDGIPDLNRRLEKEPGELLVVLGPDIDQSVAFAAAEDLRLQPAARRRGAAAPTGRRGRDGARAAGRRARGRRPGRPGRARCRLHPLARDQSRRLRRGLGRRRCPPEGRVVTVFSAKGGCGKTTIATNLGADAGRGRRRARSASSTSTWPSATSAIALQLMPARTITDASSMVGTMDEQGVRSLSRRTAQAWTRCWRRPSRARPSGSTSRWSESWSGVLRRMYDYVVIDTPPAFSEHVLAAFDASDCYVLLATLDIPALKNLRLTLEMLELLGYPRGRLAGGAEPVGQQGRAEPGRGRAHAAGADRRPDPVQPGRARPRSTVASRWSLDDPSHPVSQAVRQLARRRGRAIGRHRAPDPTSRGTAVRRSRGAAPLLRRGGAR